jgi:pimeloyl-ACP methyl ester carboxylesterase
MILGADEAGADSMGRVGVAVVWLGIVLGTAWGEESLVEIPPELGTEGYAPSGDIKIHYVTKGEGPLLVLIHGFPDYWYSWRYQIPQLSQHFQVVAIDQRGYNKSGQPTGVQEYVVDKLVEDVAAVIKHLGREKSVVAGHDWGGLVAWTFAMRHPEMTERLMIYNLPHPRGLFRELSQNPQQQKNSQYARNFQKQDPSKVNPASFALFLKFQDPEERKRYVAAFKRSSAEGMLNYYKANYPREPYDQPMPDFPKVTCPVLMFHGMDDQALLPAALAGTWDWVSDELTIVTLPGAGHWVHWDQSDKVTTKMLQWLGHR